MRPGGAEVGDPQRDQVLDTPGQLLNSGAETRGLTGDPVIDHDVGARDKPEKPPPVVIVAGIQHRSALVGVAQRERDGAAPNEWPHAAARAAARWFDLQHVGAEIGEKTGDRLAVAGCQVEYPHPEERQLVTDRHSHREHLIRINRSRDLESSTSPALAEIATWTSDPNN